jgi:prepilin-type N-terminal cleavage/methylation domain-containing protein
MFRQIINNRGPFATPLLISFLKENNSMKATQMIQNQNGFTLIELMVVAVILAIISAIAVPIYNGYKKEAMTQEAYQTLAQVADLCIGKATKGIEMGTTVPAGAVTVPGAGKYFTYAQTTACSTTAAGVYTASGATGTPVEGGTLVVTVDPTATPPSKVFSGTLF